MPGIANLLNDKPKLINVGLASLAQDASQFTEVVDLEWRPPAWGDPGLARTVARLANDGDPHSVGSRIAEANERALQRVVEAQPVVVDMKPAIEVLPDMSENTILHAGPPIEWAQMCGPVKGAVIGALIYEGRAQNEQEAVELAASGEIEFAPCHSRNAVGPMAGIISPSMPVWVVHNEEHGNTAFATMNEGWGRTLRFGAYDSAVIERLHWMEETLATSMRAVIEELGGINLKSMIAQALQMGDECHNRDIAATNLFFKTIVPALLKCDLPRKAVDETVAFLGEHEHFFLNLAMAASKASLAAAQNIPYSSMVTAIGRNGVDVGITVSGLGDTWYSDTATVAHGLYFPGYSEADANPDLGDSAITETGGIGAFVMGSAPAIVQFVGGTPEDALRMTNEMYQITLGENGSYRLPALSFAGAPTGIDILKVADTGIMPIINTGIAHKDPGHGLVGAGVVRAPRGAFEKALLAFREKYAPEETLVP